MASRMKLVIVCCLLIASQFSCNQSEKILKRVIKSTPTATSLARVKSVTITADGKTLTSSSLSESSNYGIRDTRQAESPSSSTTSTPKSSSDSPQVSTTTTTTRAPISRERELLSTHTTQTQKSIPKLNSSSELTSTRSNNLPAKLVSNSSPIAAEEDSMNVASSSHHHLTTANELSSASSSSYSSLSSNDFLRRSSSNSAYIAADTSTKGGRVTEHQQEQTNWFYPRQQKHEVRTLASGVKGGYSVKTIATTPKPEPIIQQQEYSYYPEQIVEAAPPGLAEPFAFQFKTSDHSGNGQYRSEESDKNGVVHGSYGYTDAAGIYRHVEYVADANGFRATIKSNEPGLTEAMPASIHMSHSGANSQNSGDNVPETRANVEPTWRDQSTTSTSGNLASFESAHRPERLRSPRAQF